MAKCEICGAETEQRYSSIYVSFAITAHHRKHNRRKDRLFMYLTCKSCECKMQRLYEDVLLYIKTSIGGMKNGSK